ncbi:NAD(P)-binding protein [Aspergillus karnatakaensis]|uniref:SDR family oxidoreductase n=1 Tax=Aspergillus karnatakaensis TaxID=1810916 RepID=UPI003CCCD041
MPSYLITGASRGLGFEFIRQYSQDPANLVIGLVRSVAATEKKVAAEFPDRTNIHIVHGDITDRESLKQAAEQVSKITGSSGLDVLIANAAYISDFSAWDGLGDLAAKEPTKLNDDLNTAFATNVTANIHLFTLFLPLIRLGQLKKVITLTTGMADLDFTTQFNIVAAGPYSVSKAAMNAVIAKFSAQYKSEGILFLGVSPGLVDTKEGGGEPTPEQAAGAAAMIKAFSNYAPAFTGPITPAESVGYLREVIERAHVERGYAGGFLSHYGNKQWL